jgi:hypothetical protein
MLAMLCKELNDAEPPSWKMRCPWDGQLAGVADAASLMYGFMHGVR